MTYSGFVIEFGDYSGFTDITDRVRGLQTSLKCRVGSLNMNEALLTIDNDDGAFTPGIGGTYSSVDLFSQAVIINKGSATYPVFHGIIDQVLYLDDGTNSTVQLQCVDALTIGGRSPNGYTNVAPYYTEAPAMLQGMYNGVDVATITYFDPAGLPTIGGGSTPTVDVELITPTPSNRHTMVIGTVGLGDSTVKDVLNNQMLPSFLIVAWATTIDVTGGSAVYNCHLVQQLARETPTTFQFGGNNIPIQALEVGFRTDLLYNSATADQTNGGAGPVTLRDTTSIDKYGVRHINMTQMLGYEVQQLGTTYEQWAEDYFTENYVNRFQTVRYSPVRLSVLLEAAEAAGIAEATMHSLMSVNDGIWQVAEITYRPTGAAADVTEVCVIAGRSISAVPGRTTIVLDLLPAADYQSFLLDSDVLGVLDQNRLG